MATMGHEIKVTWTFFVQRHERQPILPYFDHVLSSIKVRLLLLVMCFIVCVWGGGGVPTLMVGWWGFVCKC